MRRAVVYVWACSAATLGAAWACLPDLQIVAPPPVCGNGLIEPDAGEECDPGDAAVVGCDPQCRVPCEAGPFPFFDGVSHHCYFSPAIVTSLNLAESACEEAGAHVARFVSEGETELVMRNAPTSPFWVGLRRPAGSPTWSPAETTDEPGWVANCPGCFAHVPTGATEIPDGGLGGGNCVKSTNMVTDSWTQSACSVLPREAICEREPVGTRMSACGNGSGCFTVPATQGRKSYLLVPAKQSASDAVKACASANARLVILESPEEREQIAREVATQSLFVDVNDFWIGLSTDAGGTWSWDQADAGGLSTPPWGVGEPTAVASGTGRAFLLIDVGKVDSDLAHAADGTKSHAAVCQR